MRTRFYLAASAVGSIVAGVFACSSDDTAAPRPLPDFNGDASSAIDSTVPVADSSPDVVDSAVLPDAHATPDAQLDAGPDSINGCTEVDFADADFTADGASRIVRFPTTSIPGPYDPQCMRIKAGESVRWIGDFLSHPLYANDNNPNSPLPSASAPASDAGPDGSVTFGFPEAGWYGYACQTHGSMYGAIEVKP